VEGEDSCIQNACWRTACYFVWQCWTFMSIMHTK
jgi:hypothetical protein